MSSWEVITGDCLDVMPTLEANSVDTIITDPPYALTNRVADVECCLDCGRVMGGMDGNGNVKTCPRCQSENIGSRRSYMGKGFMGKDWDTGLVAFSPEVWREALRVAKPGAMLLAFGGSRTFHRLAVAIEDAGWEIRDTIMYLYGSGFPKSHNFGCKCTGSAVPYSHEREMERTEPKAQHDVRSLRESNLSTEIDTENQRGEVLQPGMSQQGVPPPRRAKPSAAEVWSGESGLEGRGDVLAQTWELQANQVRPMPEGIPTNGATGRLHNGTPPDNGASLGETSGTNGSGASHQPRPARQSNRESRTIQQQRRAQAGGMAAEEVCPICGKLKEWAGYGTSLKPAFEPIIVAMKPLDGTFAENAQRWKVAGYWIDGGRVEADPQYSNGYHSDETKVQGQVYGWANSDKFVRCAPSQLGRWPANIITDGSAEVLAGFPVTTSTAGNKSNRKCSTWEGGDFNPIDGVQGHNDTGSAARFFYCAKASRSERNAGLEGMPLQPGGCLDGNADTKNARKIGARPDLPVSPVANGHPTVKPLSLCRYLARLTKTPTGGVVLDPFAGSGSTGCAAVLEGRSFIGIEQDAEYADIARRRIAHWQEQGAQLELL